MAMAGGVACIESPAPGKQSRQRYQKETLSVNTTLVFVALTQNGRGAYGSSLKLKAALQLDGLMREMPCLQRLPAQIVINL